MRLLSPIILALYLNAAEAGFFVQLKTPSTIEKLLSQDDQIKATSHVRPLIENVFSFGDFEGFSGNFSKLIVKRLIKSDLVKSIVRDSAVKVFALLPETWEEIEEYVHFQLNPWEPIHYQTQELAPRHLASLSRQGALPYNESVNYYYDTQHQGENVTVYIIDTGIFREHPEFEGRVVRQMTFVNSNNGDSSGHGTHVAGVVGSHTFGVAKKVSMIDLKLLDSKGTGSLTSVLALIQYATRHREKSGQNGVINLSLGSHKNDVLNAALEASTKSGMVVVAAAGNFASDSCRTSPASAEGAISVGAFDDRTDKMAHFTNYGRCVDIFASGIDVHSVSHRKKTSAAVMSGTSMSAPSIAGLSAILLSQGVPAREVKNRLVQFSVCNRIKETILDTPNRIAFNGIEREDDDYPLSAIYDPNIHTNFFRPENPSYLDESREDTASIPYANSTNDLQKSDFDGFWEEGEEDGDEDDTTSDQESGKEEEDDFDYEDSQLQVEIKDGIILVRDPRSEPTPLIWW